MYSINEIKIKSTMTNLKFHKSCDHDLFTWSLFKKFRLNGLNSDQIQTTFGQMVWIQTSSEKSDQSGNSAYFRLVSSGHLLTKKWFLTRLCCFYITAILSWGKDWN